jgi:ATP-dependent helicase HrpA
VQPTKKAFPFRLEFPPELPISARADEITAALEHNQVIILAGETGSGKTTQIPKLCLAAGLGTKGRIACTQPRRVAALSVSRRVAEELNVEWGKEVGSKVRFGDHTDRSTVIKFLTDGMLLAEVQSDPLLREYDTIIIDEAHERSLNIDFLLGHLRLLRFKRPELKIVITSATIDTAAFSEAFENAPIIKVEGRTYPVEVIYAPLDSFGLDADPNSAEPAEKAEALHYIDGAIEALDRILNDSDSGDVLVFMPSERDIREVKDLLTGKSYRNCEIVPLFGRLTNDEQQRVFAPTQKRKIVVATNIAETSLTIPGIRFVVDTGLSRVSRYSPTARTRRLPIEAVSQSSADQRKGRCGRVSNGVCIRLFSEEDYLSRPRFSQPEIQRSNLADVILKLKAFGLGDVERFPFINPPADKAIRAGYSLLEELGAIVKPESKESNAHTWQLTTIGSELARLPLDPSVARMTLQARDEKAVKEVLIIASGLSIQDPRERPLENQAQADNAHRRFVHPDSDFLTLLNIWEAYHNEFDSMTQSKLRRFCKEHFLSYARMREWRDIHQQLIEVLKERKGIHFSSVFDGLKNHKLSDRNYKTNQSESDHPKLTSDTPGYRAIHRSILAGLLGNIGVKENEGSGFKVTHDRKVVLFPGSALFKRNTESKPGVKNQPESHAKKPSNIRWIMASEIMETTRLYARCCAKLDPIWALDLGKHVTKVSYSEPFWDENAGRVRVKQKTRLYGLEIDSRAVGYGKIDPAAATEIFIREGLVNDTINAPLDFIVHNRAIKDKLIESLTRSRSQGTLNIDEALYRFYASHFTLDKTGPEGISSVAELSQLVRKERATNSEYLYLKTSDLHDTEEIVVDLESFPASLPLANHAIPIHYIYKPGQEDDGVTIDVKLSEVNTLTAAALDWAVPGHLEAKVEHYLKTLPKDLRRAFIPLSDHVTLLTEALRSRDRLTGRRETVAESLASEMRERFKMHITASLWEGKQPPDYLRVQVRVIDAEGSVIAQHRELDQLALALKAHTHEASKNIAKHNPEAWQNACARWEKPSQTTWAFGDIPLKIQVSTLAGVPAFAFPGLCALKDGVSLRLFKTESEALKESRLGISALLDKALGHELGWIERDLRSIRNLAALTATLAPIDEIQSHTFNSIKRWVCDSSRVLGQHKVDSLKQETFNKAVINAKADLKNIVSRYVELLREILTLRITLQVHTLPYPGLSSDLDSLINPYFIKNVPFERLQHFPRYLKGMQLRADRWRKNPAKDTEKSKVISQYIAAENKLRPSKDSAPTPMRWLIEELRVSLFAQELGTAESISPTKLDQAFKEYSLTGSLSHTQLAPKPIQKEAPLISKITDPGAKKSTIKNLNSLEKFFPKSL